MKNVDRFVSKIILIYSFVLLLFSLLISGFFPFYQGSFYSFALPFIFHISFCVLFSGLLVLFKPERIRSFLFVLLIVFSLNYFYSRYAVEEWPGGDDGPGMGWVFLVDLGSLIGLFVEIGLLIVVVIESYFKGIQKLQACDNILKWTTWTI